MKEAGHGFVLRMDGLDIGEVDRAVQDQDDGGVEGLASGSQTGEYVVWSERNEMADDIHWNTGKRVVGGLSNDNDDGHAGILGHGGR